MEATPPHASARSSTRTDPQPQERARDEVTASVAPGSLFSDDSPLAASPFARTRLVLEKDSLGRVDLTTHRCLHCGVEEATTSFSDVVRSGARFVGGVRAAFIGMWLAFVGLVVVTDAPRLSSARDLLDLTAATVSGWALFGLVFGGVLLGAHGLASHRVGVKLGLCRSCSLSAERATGLRGALEAGSIFGAALTVVGLAIFLSAPAPCACEQHNPSLVLLVVLPGLLLPACALGRLALSVVRRDRDVHLSGVAPGRVRLDVPAPMGVLLRRAGKDVD